MKSVDIICLFCLSNMLLFDFYSNWVKGQFRIQGDGPTPKRVIFKSLICMNFFFLSKSIMFLGLENKFRFA